MLKKRAIIVVLDSVGIGALPDAHEFGDAGAHTLGNINAVRKLNIPNLENLGIGNIQGSNLNTVKSPAAAFGKAMEVTKAKDTTSGHWEMMGVVMDPPFKTYPNGFPDTIIARFTESVGRAVMGNCVASGTEIIQRLGDEHVKTGALIVYTSADSVFQIAAHEDVVPLEELYSICETAREILTGDDLVGRVIARPFIGGNGVYTRTENRRDYAIPPIDVTVLDGLVNRGKNTVCIGKIEDVFYDRGITVSDHTKNNPEGIEATIKYIRNGEGDLIFANLVDFDMLYGHRNDVEGYACALEYFDSKLPEIVEAMTDNDILIITADHGCDPTYPGTDHTREFIPILAFGTSIKAGVDIGIRNSFADIGSTVMEYICGEPWTTGESFLGKIIK